MVLFLIFRGTSILLCTCKCTSLHSYPQCMGVPFSLYPHQHLSFLVFLILAILTSMRSYISCCGFGLHFLMISDIEKRFFFFLSLFILRESESVSGGGAEREGKRENPKWGLHCPCGARCGAPSHKPRDRELSRSQESDARLTEPPRHPK